MQSVTISAKIFPFSTKTPLPKKKHHVITSISKLLFDFPGEWGGLDPLFQPPLDPPLIIFIEIEKNPKT